MNDENKNMSAEEIQHSLHQVPDIPEIYFNGFQLGLSNSDINALLLRNGKPLAHLNMSFTTAKTLLAHLTNLMGKLEQITEHTIMTTMQVDEGMKLIHTGDGE